MNPTFPLLRPNQTAEELTANMEYITEMKIRITTSLKHIERTILIRKIQAQPFF